MSYSEYESFSSMNGELSTSFTCTTSSTLNEFTFVQMDFQIVSTSLKAANVCSFKAPTSISSSFSTGYLA